MTFRIQKKSRRSKARSGTLHTEHGMIRTPFFMPIATRGVVKAATTAEMREAGAQILLSNTYHLWQRPGLPIMHKAGGLHSFMSWPGPILTDSGGYQVFSLSRYRKITKRGVIFTSEIDGKKLNLTPEKAIDIQLALGSDIIMCLDECSAYPATREAADRARILTAQWAKRCKKRWQAKRKNKSLLFGIVQGSVYLDLRTKSVEELVQQQFDGYALGGLVVGEPPAEMYKVLRHTLPLLPQGKPRYLMGVGKPEQMVRAIREGIDMFDCVIPTRNARHGVLFAFHTVPNRDFSSRSWYKEIHIKNARYKNDFKPVDSHCSCYACRNYTKAYLRHLFMIGEPLGQRLATIHNIFFYTSLMERLRRAIRQGKL